MLIKSQSIFVRTFYVYYVYTSGWLLHTTLAMNEMIESRHTATCGVTSIREGGGGWGDEVRVMRRGGGQAGDEVAVWRTSLG